MASDLRMNVVNERGRTWKKAFLNVLYHHFSEGMNPGPP
jgi:hypothetical protein